MRKHTVEIWRAIQDYEGLYEVSNWGRVRSVGRYIESVNQFGKFVKYLNGKVLRQTLGGRGYLEVDFYKNGVREPKKVHRLVAEAFLPNQNGYTVVHHKSHNKLDNRVENLCWMNDAEHRALHGTERGEQRSKTVYQYTVDGELVKVWKSANECGRNGLNKGNISACCSNKFNREGNNKYKGYIWSHSPL